MNKYLIVKTSSLGDIIQTLPIISILKSHDPECLIDWVVEEPFYDVLMANKDIHKVLTINSKKWRKALCTKTTWNEIFAFNKGLRNDRYHAVFDLQGNTKSSLVTAQAKSDNKIGFGYHTVPEWLNLLFTHKRFNPPKGVNIREDYAFIVRKALEIDKSQEIIAINAYEVDVTQSELVQRLLEQSTLGKNKFLICPGSAWKNKRLSNDTLKRFLELVSEEYNASFLFIWGNEAEKELVKQLHEHFSSSFIVDKLSLPNLRTLMERVQLVIAMDSLPLHLAGITNTPSFSVFGASSANKYKPQGEQHFAIQGQCPYKMTFEKRCPLLRTCPTGGCMNNLSPLQLFVEFNEWYKQIAISRASD